jgi:hypothetical protein
MTIVVKALVRAIDMSSTTRGIGKSGSLTHWGMVVRGSERRQKSVREGEA